MSDYYNSEDLTVPVPDGPLTVSYPSQELGDNSHILFSQPYVQLAASYSPPTLNATFGSGYCVGDVNKTDAGAGVVKFSREWMTIPAQKVDSSDYSFTYPAFFELRDSFSQTVPLKIVQDFYLIGPGTAYSTQFDIPQINETRVTFGSGIGSGSVPLGANVELNNGGGVLTISSPTITAYKTWISSGGFNIVVAPSTVDRVRGNIFVRTTNRVQPL